MKYPDSPPEAGPLSGVMAGREHHIRFRIYYEDTDSGGVVYYANYLKLAERARTEMLHSLGPAGAAVLGTRDLAFAVRRCEIDYLAPARLGDIIDIISRVTHIGGARVTMTQAFSRDTRPLATLCVDLACIDRTGKVSRMPKDLHTALCARRGV